MSNGRRIIRESRYTIQDMFIEMLLEIKSERPDLSKGEILDTMKNEFDKFVDFNDINDNDKVVSGDKHKKTIPSNNPNIGKGAYYDRMPTRKIVYNKKR